MCTSCKSRKKLSVHEFYRSMLTVPDYALRFYCSTTLQFHTAFGTAASSWGLFGTLKTERISASTLNLEHSCACPYSCWSLSRAIRCSTFLRILRWRLSFTVFQTSRYQTSSLTRYCVASRVRSCFEVLCVPHVIDVISFWVRQLSLPPAMTYMF